MTRSIWSRAAVLAAALVCASSGITLRGQSSASNPAGEWRAYGGDPGIRGTRRSIRSTAKTSASLTVAWRFKTDHLGPRPEFMFESTPVMANGVLYSTAAAAAPSWRWIRRPESSCGCTASAKARAARRRRGSCRAAGSRTGPTARRNGSSTSRLAISSSRSTPRPAGACQASATTASSI